MLKSKKLKAIQGTELRIKFDKLRRSGRLKETEYKDLMRKLDEHDREMRNNLLDYLIEVISNKTTSFKDRESKDYGLIHYETFSKLIRDLKEGFNKQQDREIATRNKSIKHNK